MERFLITGGDGFIGSYLVDRLLREETAEICVIDSRHSSRVHPKLEFIQLDISKPGWTADISGSADVVFHLAQSNRYRDFPEGTKDMVAVNITATAELLEWSRKHGVNRFVFSSTGNVYSKSKQPLQTNAPCDPASMYAATKLCAEHLIMQYAHFFQINILRLFSVYGPKQKGMLIPTLIERIKTGGEITLAQGEGIYLTPIFISDCVETFARIAGISMGQPNLYNVAGGDVINLASIVRILENYLGLKANIRITDEEPMYLLGDGNEIGKAINFYPSVDVSTGLANTISENSSHGMS